MERASGEASERSGECRESNGAPNFPSIFREITMASLSLLPQPFSPGPSILLKDISSIVKDERIQTYQQFMLKLGILDYGGDLLLSSFKFVTNLVWPACLLVICKSYKFFLRKQTFFTVSPNPVS